MKQVRDFWTPSDQAVLDDNDLDFGSATPIPVLGDNFLFVGGKEGTLYLLNSSALGGYNATNHDANAHFVIESDANKEIGTNGIYRCAASIPLSLIMPHCLLEGLECMGDDQYQDLAGTAFDCI